jgi:hypothetical protein
MAGGWETLRAILDTDAAEQEELRTRPPVACPNDGEPLIKDPEGRLHCRWDGWIWDGLPPHY